MSYNTGSFAYKTGEHSTVPTAGARGTSGWVGWIAFAAVMLILLGMFHVLQGIVAIAKDELYVVTSSGLAVDVDYTTWGWTHLIAGVIVILAGIGIFAGQMWARVVGTVIAVLSALINMVFLPAYPFWSMLMIGLCVLVVMALTVHGSEIRAGE
jgi:hypothetical protein